MTKSEWYREGLTFSCTECGKCCTGSPGYVWVSEEEMEEIATFLNISLKDLKRKYIRRVGNRYSLIESKKTYDCVFLKDKKCQVYGARPTQCRTYPWWPQNLNSEEAWAGVGFECEGVGNGNLPVPFEKIEEQKLIQIGRNEEDR